jgi:WD40 repeat protein
MKKLLLIISLFVVVYAKDIKPFMQIDAKGIVKDMVLGKDNSIILGTDAGELLEYDYKNKKIIKEIKVPDVKDFMGDIMKARVSSVDYLEGRYLLLNDSGVGGYADLRIHENNKTIDIFSEKDKLPIIKARFITKDTVLLGFLSNEVALYDLKNKKFIYRFQINESKFSDFALNEKRDLAAFSCESGVITIVDIKKGKIVKELSGLNLDNVYKVDFKNGYVSCAGQDRRGSWYNVSSAKGDYIEGKFLIYATALSPDASLVAFPMDEKNNIYIYNLSTKSKLYILKGQKSTLNTIIFKDKNTLFSASDDNYVMMWKLN